MNKSWFARFRHWLDQQILSESARQGLAALIVGLFSAIAVLLFKTLADGIYLGLYRGLGSHLPPWGLILFPALGGLLIGLLRQTWLPEERFSGVGGIMEAVALAGGRLRYLHMPLKAVLAALSLGVGAPLGPEDPSAQIGANIGTVMGQWLRGSEEQTRLLVATGAAAGIAALFNAPIAGVFFAIEIILGELVTSQLSAVILGAVLAAVIGQAGRGLINAPPLLTIPTYTFNNPIEILFYLGLGALAALVAVTYIRTLHWVHDKMQRLPLPTWIKPALVGLVIGLVGLRFPELLGDSYAATGQLLKGSYWVPALLLLVLVLKMILTASSLGAGFMGGIFAPALFIGAILGELYGTALNALFPTLGLSPSTFAMIGMAAVLAATIRAPITSIMLVFELTNDYRVILPLMFAIVTGNVLTQLLEPESAYTFNLTRKGIHLQRGRDVDILETLTVAEVMDKTPLTVTSNLPLRMVSAILAQFHTHGLPVLTPQGELYGVITLQDIERASQENPANLNRPIADFCTRDLLLAYPDETVQEALQRMSSRGVGRMPVVERNNAAGLIGWLHRADIIRAYELALVRRTTQNLRREQIQLGTTSGASVFELEVQAGSPADGRLVSDIIWPEESLVASLQRRRQLIIPRGQTRLQAGDRLAVVANPEDEPLLRQLVEGTK